MIKLLLISAIITVLSRLLLKFNAKNLNDEEKATLLVTDTYPARLYVIAAIYFISAIATLSILIVTIITY